MQRLQRGGADRIYTEVDEETVAAETVAVAVEQVVLGVAEAIGGREQRQSVVALGQIKVIQRQRATDRVVIESVGGKGNDQSGVQVGQRHVLGTQSGAGEFFAEGGGVGEIAWRHDGALGRIAIEQAAGNRGRCAVEIGGAAGNLEQIGAAAAILGTHVDSIETADRGGKFNMLVAAIGRVVCRVVGWVDHAAIRGMENYRDIQVVAGFAGAITGRAGVDHQRVAQVGGEEVLIGIAHREVDHRIAFRRAHAVEHVEPEIGQFLGAGDGDRLRTGLAGEVHDDLGLARGEGDVVAIADVIAGFGEGSWPYLGVIARDHMGHHRVAGGIAGGSAALASRGVVGDQPVVGRGDGGIAAGSQGERLITVGPQVGEDR